MISNGKEARATINREREREINYHYLTLTESHLQSISMPVTEPEIKCTHNNIFVVEAMNDRGVEGITLPDMHVLF